MDEAIILPHAAAHETALGFDGFFEANRDNLTRALWLVTRDRHEAEEIAQDAFARLWERWEQVSRVQDPEAYLFRTALNLYRNRRRRAALALRRLVRTVAPSDPMEAIDERDAVIRALGRLTPRQRSAVVLLDLVDMTSEEAGRTLGVRPSTVRVLAARARVALREEIGGDDG